MIQSIFILSPTGEVLIERHFRGVVTPRTVSDYYWERVSAPINHHGGYTTASSFFGGLVDPTLHDTVPPVMEISVGAEKFMVFSVLRDGLSYLAVVGEAVVSPLVVVEFLHRVADTFVDYFGDPADESAIKDNFSTVYQLLEEMVDYGWPLTTEPNALKAMIRPPNIIRKVRNKEGTAVVGCTTFLFVMHRYRSTPPPFSTLSMNTNIPTVPIGIYSLRFSLPVPTPLYSCTAAIRHDWRIECLVGRSTVRYYQQHALESCRRKAQLQRDLH